MHPRGVERVVDVQAEREAGVPRPVQQARTLVNLPLIANRPAAQPVLRIGIVVGQQPAHEVSARQAERQHAVAGRRSHEAAKALSRSGTEGLVGIEL